METGISVIVFNIVYKTLMKIAKKTSLTYYEVNILAYYLVIPLLWAVMADCLIGLPVFTGIIICTWIIIFTTQRHRFSKWCDSVYKLSVTFLLSFKCWNYNTSSVIICVVVPLIISLALLMALIS